MTACDIEDAREVGVAAVMDCLVREVSQVKVGDHYPQGGSSARDGIPAQALGAKDGTKAR